jgi:hypothetical protein
MNAAGLLMNKGEVKGKSISVFSERNTKFDQTGSKSHDFSLVIRA